MWLWMSPFSIFDPAALQNLKGHRDREWQTKMKIRSVLTATHSNRLTQTMQHAAVRAPTSSSTRHSFLPVSTRLTFSSHLLWHGVLSPSCISGRREKKTPRCSAQKRLGPVVHQTAALLPPAAPWRLPSRGRMKEARGSFSRWVGLCFLVDGKENQKQENVQSRFRSPESGPSQRRPAPAADILWVFVVSVQTWLTCHAHPAPVSVSSPLLLTPARVPPKRAPVCTASSGARTSAAAEGRSCSSPSPVSDFAKEVSSSVTTKIPLPQVSHSLMHLTKQGHNRRKDVINYWKRYIKRAQCEQHTRGTFPPLQGVVVTLSDLQKLPWRSEVHPPFQNQHPLCERDKFNPLHLLENKSFSCLPFDGITGQKQLWLYLSSRDLLISASR